MDKDEQYEQDAKVGRRLRMEREIEEELDNIKRDLKSYKVGISRMSRAIDNVDNHEFIVILVRGSTDHDWNISAMPRSGDTDSHFVKPFPDSSVLFDLLGKRKELIDKLSSIRRNT